MPLFNAILIIKHNACLAAFSIFFKKRKQPCPKNSGSFDL